MSTDVIPLSVPSLLGNEKKYVDECLQTNFVSSVGPFVERFEREFASYVGSRFAVACASGTAAIHVALRLLGVVTDDEVMVPTLTFIASANPVLYEHARPILVDSESTTWNLDARLVAEELARRARLGARMPKVVEVVHILGHPVDLEPIADACEQHGVLLLEDAAEAMGAKYTAGRFAGKSVGTIGRIGCFSFNGNKIMTTGGGGMLVTDDEKLARRAKHLTTQARLPGAEYDHDEVGYNYRLTNVAAALGVAQLEQMGSFLERKRSIAKRYDESLAVLPGVVLPPNEPWAEPSHWLYTIGLEPHVARLGRAALMQALDQKLIQSRPIWRPLHHMPMFAGSTSLGGDTADRLFASGLSLPCSVSLTDEDQERVIGALCELLT